MKNNRLWNVSEGGDILRNDLHSDTKKKYKPDLAVDKSFIPYLVMVLCATIDLVFFISLANVISYDSPLLAIFEVAAFMFAFDVVPIYLGFQYKRVKMIITNDKGILIAAVAVFALGIILNIVLRALTITELSPSVALDTTSMYGRIAEETAEPSISKMDIANAILGMVCPIITSLGSFYISYISYNPWKTKMRSLEERMSDKKDALRRYEAILQEAKADVDFEKNIHEDDERKFEEMKKYQKAKVLGYCDYVRERLKEHIGDPTSNNILSEEACLELLARLDKELKALDENYDETTILPAFVENKAAEA